MPRMPGATWRPIEGNFTPRGQVEVRGVVVHIMAGTLAGTDSWFRNERAQASSHFGTGKKGALYQWVDTKDRAWAQGAGNRSWISVENEGKGGDELTEEQLDLNARILVWAHKVHGVPLQVTNNPNGRGLGHHGMGGAAWGNHPACPGPRIVAQKVEIVRRAKALIEEREEPVKVGWVDGIPIWPGRILKLTDPMMSGEDVKVWQAKLKARGWNVDVDGWFGKQSSAVCAYYQKATGLEVTGRVDRITWDMTWSWRPPRVPGIKDESN